MKRRNFLKKASALSLVAGLSPNVVLSETPASKKPSDDRAYWAQLLEKIAEPVLSNMSRGELRKNMRVEYSPLWGNRDRRVAYMEAFDRGLRKNYDLAF